MIFLNRIDIKQVIHLYLLDILVTEYSIELGTKSVASKDIGLNATHLIVTFIQLSDVRSIENSIVCLKLQFSVSTSELDIFCMGVLYFVKLELLDCFICISKNPGGFPI